MFVPFPLAIAPYVTHRVTGPPSHTTPTSLPAPSQDREDLARPAARPNLKAVNRRRSVLLHRVSLGPNQTSRTPPSTSIPLISPFRGGRAVADLFWRGRSRRSSSRSMRRSIPCTRTSRGWRRGGRGWMRCRIRLVSHFFSIVVQALAERGLQCEGLEGGMRCRRRWLLERMAVVRRFGGWPRIWWWSYGEGLCDAQSG